MMLDLMGRSSAMPVPSVGTCCILLLAGWLKVQRNNSTTTEAGWLVVVDMLSNYVHNPKGKKKKRLPLGRKRLIVKKI